ncbi:MAG: LacI family DNA-binding transcriptional regulator, partial [Janthinobacterium lividum]
MGVPLSSRGRTSPTIFDVARLAGVSHQTVSRVINNHASVRETTRERVRQAVEQLSYRPNAAARAMVGGRTRNLGLITTGSSDYGPSSTVLGLLSAARAADYSISVATAIDTEPESVQAAVDLVLGQHVEALVVVASRVRILDGLAGL